LIPTTTNLKSTGNQLLHASKQEVQGQESVQDNKGEGPTRSHGLQEDHVSQKEEEEIAPAHEIAFLSVHLSPKRRKRIRVGFRLHACESDRTKL
jgi:hypothetical protein